MSTPDRPVPEHPTPEDEGIPDHADDTSTAFREADRPRFNDSPAPLPADEPQAIDEYGLTGDEARQGEPLARRLAREEPEVGSTGPGRSSEPAQPTGRDGLSAEEAAMREVPEDELPDQP